MSFLNRHLALGYLILAIGVVLGILALGKYFEKNLRGELSSMAYEQCIAGIAQVEKYNKLVRENVALRETVALYILRDGNSSEISAELFRKNTEILEATLITPPTLEQCQDLRF